VPDFVHDASFSILDAVFGGRFFTAGRLGSKGIYREILPMEIA
jgi:hypothetical protein